MKYLNFRKLWEEKNGSVPEGWAIQHRDGNQRNNDFSNLFYGPVDKQA